MRFVIYGAGGHGKVVREIVEAAGDEVVAYFDDAPAAPLMGLRVCTDMRELPPFDACIVAMGDNAIRAEKAARLRALGIPLGNAVHPTAVISRGARLGQGVLVAPHVIVDVDVWIGDNVILNKAASVSHDSVIADDVHLAPGARAGGQVQVGNGAFVGMGALLLPGISVGAWCVCGAGAVVTRDVPPGITVVGAPARPLRAVSPVAH